MTALLSALCVLVLLGTLALMINGALDLWESFKHRNPRPVEPRKPPVLPSAPDGPAEETAPHQPSPYDQHRHR